MEQTGNSCFCSQPRIVQHSDVHRSSNAPVNIQSKSECYKGSLNDTKCLAITLLHLHLHLHRRFDNNDSDVEEDFMEAPHPLVPPSPPQ